MPEPKKTRLAGIDLLKIFAIFSVVCVHFSYHTEYYSTPIETWNMLLQSWLRWIFYTGVPIFIMCTGYLNAGKKPSWAYYKKLLRVLVPYTVISVICLLVRTHKGEVFTLKNAVVSVFKFSADGYAWYINMYIGLYLIAPFLNAAAETLTKKQFRLAIAGLTAAIPLAYTVNQILTKTPSIAWFSLPDWFCVMYPLFYYTVGVYFSRWPVAPKRAPLFLLVLAVPLLQTLLQIYFSSDKTDNWFLTHYSSLFAASESILIFLLLYRADLKSPKLKKALAVISNMTLEIYLFSYLTDADYYKWFGDHLFGQQSQETVFALYFAAIVLLSFGSSLLLAFCYHTLRQAVIWLCRRLRRGAEKRPPEQREGEAEQA